MAWTRVSSARLALSRAFVPTGSPAQAMFHALRPVEVLSAGPAVGRVRRGPRGGEDGRDHPRVGDDGEHSQCCAAARATSDVDVDHPAQPLSPCHRCASGRRPLVGTLARRRGPDETAMARVPGKQAVEPNQVTARARHRRSQAGDEVERDAESVEGRASPPRRSHGQGFARDAVRVFRRALPAGGGILRASTAPLEALAPPTQARSRAIKIPLSLALSTLVLLVSCAALETQDGLVEDARRLHSQRESVSLEVREAELWAGKIERDLAAPRAQAQERCGRACASVENDLSTDVVSMSAEAGASAEALEAARAKLRRLRETRRRIEERYREVLRRCIASFPTEAEGREKCES